MLQSYPLAARARAAAKSVGRVFAQMVIIGALTQWPGALDVRAESAPALPQFGGHFALLTAEGKRVTEQSFPGKWLLIYFGYTSCPDACPTALNAVAGALDQLGPLADKVQPIFITVDPQRDTPAVIADYVRQFDPRLLALTGSVAEIAAAAKEFRVFYREQPLGNGEYAIDHSSFIYVVNPRHQVAELLTGNLPGHSIAVELRHMLE